MRTVSLSYINNKNLPEKWFENLFGFKETMKNVFNNILIEHDSYTGNIRIQSKINHKSFHVGKLTFPSLATLRKRYHKITKKLGDVVVKHCAINDILEYHHLYPNATFQVASQFNCLEFSNPNITPKNGITDYVFDYTQGPACALACAAGTLYRNYIQMKYQVNNLCVLEKILPNFWNIQNGYMISDKEKLEKLNRILLSPICNTTQIRNQLLDSIRIGLHENVGVIFSKRFVPIIEENIQVTQCYCSAISCGYSNISNTLWEPLARIILEANYEATIWAAAINYALGGSKDVFLTFLGGGAFKNNHEWIADAIGRTIYIAKKHKLGVNIHICHYNKIDSNMKILIETAIQEYEKKND